MKLNWFLKAVLFVLLVNYKAAAQEVLKVEADSIPVLEEWWRGDGISDGGSLSYLPNFKNGYNAVAVSMANGEVHTWLNRFPGDTENVFTWKADLNNRSFGITYGDFNGDGIRDYIDGAGNIYRGIQNGQPPEPTPVTSYISLFLLFHGKVYDVNNDGFDDIIGGISYQTGKNAVLRIVYGEPDIHTLTAKSIELPAIKDFPSAIFKTPQGEMRLITWQSTSSSEGYILYRLKWTQVGQTPTLEKLDEFSDPKTTQKYTGSHAIYQSKENDKTFFFAVEIINGIYENNNILIYDVTDDKFTEHLKFRMTYAIPVLLNHSIDGDDYEDWYIRRSQTESWFFSGGEKFDSLPRTKAINLHMTNVISINDVNNDGINDIATTGYAFDDRTFGILKGKDLTTSINETTQPNFSLKTFKTTSTHFTISFALVKESHATFSLFDMEGKRVKVLKEGMFEAGAQSFTWDSGDMPQGAYLLRLTADGQTATEKVLVTK